jgi:hypothetical protein
MPSTLSIPRHLDADRTFVGVYRFDPGSMHRSISQTPRAAPDVNLTGC